MHHQQWRPDRFSAIVYALHRSDLKVKIEGDKPTNEINIAFVSQKRHYPISYHSERLSAMQDTTMVERTFSPPRASLLLQEAPRLFGELTALIATAPFLNQAPRGDGHPVLVLPGFSASDRSTSLLRRFLVSKSYTATPWGLGRNLGPAMPDLAARLAKMFETVYENGNQQKVSIVGWSLGGVYARLLAHHYPDKIRNVITLGSPYRGSPRSTRVYPLVQGMMDRPLAQQSISDLRHLAGTPLENVPTASIFSRRDAIVPWQIATEPTSAVAENIEVFTSHLGLGFSPAVLFALADRLAKPDGEWQRFQRSGWKQAIYGAADIEQNSRG
jgi:pimeloyl-ACP methyl ester carboxylesterase